MTEQNWKPHFRAPISTLARVLRSSAFLHSRERSAVIAEDPVELRRLADAVEALDHGSPPLAVVADQVVAAVRFLRALADRLDAAVGPGPADPVPTEAGAESGSEAGSGAGPGRTSTAGVLTRERLVVASLHYLVTPVDLVPDFRAGGYIDDVVLLSWVFGVATNELAPYVTDGPGAGPREL